MGMTPLEAWSGIKPDVSHLREFGCDVWILNEDKNRLKLAPKSKKMIFTGFEDGPKAVHYYDAVTQKIKVSQNFAFNKNEEPRLETSSNVPGLPTEGEPAKVTITSHDDGPNPASDQTHNPAKLGDYIREMWTLIIESYITPKPGQLVDHSHQHSHPRHKKLHPQSMPTLRSSRRRHSWRIS